MIKGKRVVVPEFEIFSNPTINISAVSQRRFSLFDRELSEEYILSQMVKSSSVKDYIFNYIKIYNRYDNLRKVLTEHYPEHEETLEKLLLLK